MSTFDGLEVRVAQRGERFIWELHRDGIPLPVKFSIPIFLSEASANASGAAARTAHLARLAKTISRNGSRVSRPTPKAVVDGGGMDFGLAKDDPATLEPSTLT